ncbi:putative [histone H3]-lysine(4) N-trimethyltransferase chromatin remodeling SET family [Dioscorea sansibarensis]
MDSSELDLAVNGDHKPQLPSKRSLLPHCPNEDDGDEALFSKYLSSISSSLDLIPTPSKRSRSDDMVRVSSSDDAFYRSLVRRTRITYDSLRSLVAAEERRLSPGHRRRADLIAGAKMKRLGLWLHRDKRIIGSIPGVSVGDIFFYRVELMAVAVHGHIQAGIDYVCPRGGNACFPIATSVVLSGGYEDDDDQGDVIIYTGSGGRKKNEVSTTAPQRLSRGNLALEKSKEFGIELRVIRGFTFDRSPSGRVYVYNGLYKVIDSWPDAGKSGFGVYKFKLLRIAGQEPMGSVVLQLAMDLKTKILKSRPSGYLSQDISNGQERYPISIFNDIDNDKEPLLFEYVRKPEYPSIILQETMEMKRRNGCRCVENCCASCACAKRNGGEFAYDGNGLLLRGKPLVYECGTSCRCPPSCPNRVSQKGLRHQLEVFRSKETGWGVRSLDVIRAGEFICEFTGKVRTEDQLEAVMRNGGSLVYPSLFPGRWREWGDISDVVGDHKPHRFSSYMNLSFAMDVTRKRNVACYLSHSTRPNVFVQMVLHDHYNEMFPHLMVFAMENIPPLRELSIDYGVEMDNFVD